MCSRFGLPHRRYNPLKQEWVIVAPQRCKRPWKGETEKPQEEKIPSFDPGNPLCPGAKRSSGILTPTYESTFVFSNDFPALMDGPEMTDTEEKEDVEEDSLFLSRPARGDCRVMCFHPKSDLQLSTMERKDVVAVIDTWIQQMEELGKIEVAFISRL